MCNKEVAVPIKKITKIHTICKFISSKECNKECLPELHYLIQQYSSVALSAVIVERAYSTEHQIESWLRPNMTANSLAIIGLLINTNNASTT